MREITSLFESAKELFEEFTISRLFSWIFVGALIIIALFLWDLSTGYFYYSSLDRKVDLLRELHDLEQDGVTQNDDLRPVYEEVSKDLAEHRDYPIGETRIKLSTSSFKFISASLVGLLMIIVGLAQYLQREEGWKSLLAAGLILAAVTGYIGVSIPTATTPWINYIGCGGSQILFLMVLAWVSNRSKRNNRTSYEREEN